MINRQATTICNNRISAKGQRLTFSVGEVMIRGYTVLNKYASKYARGKMGGFYGR